MKSQSNLLYYVDAFDPVTEADFSFASEASKKLGMNVAFLPLPDLFLKKGGATISQREQMLRIAMKGNPAAFVLSPRFELENPEKEEGSHSFLLKRETYAALKESGFFESASSSFQIYLLDGKEEGAASLHLSQPAMDLKKIRSLACPGIGSELWGYIEENRLYYVGYLEKKLASEHRFQHSLSVAHLCYRIAVSNGFPSPERAYVAGIFHDLGKHCPKDEEQSIMREHFPEYASFPSWSYHQFTGEYLAKEELGIEDEEILDAIEFHSTGKKSMSPLGKIVYASDKIDPLRGYDSSWMIQECLKDDQKGFLTVLKENRAYLTGKGYKVDNPLTKECFLYYLGE